MNCAESRPETRLLALALSGRRYASGISFWWGVKDRRLSAGGVVGWGNGAVRWKNGMGAVKKKSSE